MARPQQPPRIASAPFDNSKGNADIILRSSDNVDFYAHKCFLTFVSLIFEDMVTSSNPGQDIHPSNGLPVVELAEGSQILECLLRLCYPTPDPVMKDLALIADALAAAIKYEMEYASAWLREPLLSFVSQVPVRVYAIACRLHLEDCAREAARAVLKVDEIAYERDMDHISAGAFYRVLAYRRTGKMPPSFTFHTPEAPAQPLPQSDETFIVPPHFLHPSADAILRSVDGSDFHVHRFILSLTSPVFTELLSAPAETAHPRSTDNLPVFSVSEECVTVLRLLQLCYPLEDPQVANLTELFALRCAAMKYKVTRAISFTQKQWRERIDEDPLRSYLIAMERGWDDAAREAALSTTVRWYDEYIPEMERSPADVYFRLLEFRSRCHRDVFHSVLNDYRRKCWGSRLTWPSAFDVNGIHWGRQTRSTSQYSHIVPDARFCVRILQTELTALDYYQDLLSFPVLGMVCTRGNTSITQTQFVEDCSKVIASMRRAYSDIQL